MKRTRKALLHSSNEMKFKKMSRRNWWWWWVELGRSTWGKCCGWAEKQKSKGNLSLSFFSCSAINSSVVLLAPSLRWWRDEWTSYLLRLFLSFSVFPFFFSLLHFPHFPLNKHFLVFSIFVNIFIIDHRNLSFSSSFFSSLEKWRRFEVEIGLLSCAAWAGNSFFVMIDERTLTITTTTTFLITSSHPFGLSTGILDSEWKRFYFYVFFFVLLQRPKHEMPLTRLNNLMKLKID